MTFQKPLVKMPWFFQDPQEIPSEMHSEKIKTGSPSIGRVAVAIGISGAFLWWLIEEFLGITPGFGISLIGFESIVLLVLLRRRIPRVVILFALPLLVFCTTVIFWNAGKDKGSDALLYLTLPYRFWTNGHWMGVFFVFWAGVWLWNFWDEMEKPPEDREEVLSGPKLISHAEALERASKLRGKELK